MHKRDRETLAGILVAGTSVIGVMLLLLWVTTPVSS